MTLYCFAIIWVPFLATNVKDKSPNGSKRPIKFPFPVVIFWLFGNSLVVSIMACKLFSVVKSFKNADPPFDMHKTSSAFE